MAMRVVDLADATRPLAEYAKAIQDGEGPVIVIAAGRPVAAVIRVTDADDLESLALSTHPKFIEIIERSRRRHAREGGISNEELRRRLESS